MRAALVDHTSPYASEEPYFWRYITEADLMTLVERAPDLFLPRMLDRLSLEPYLVLVQKDITAQLAHMPVDVSHPNSEYMVQRGIITGRCFEVFVHDLAGRATHNRYHPGTEMALTPKDRDLGAVGLRSHKKSLDEADEDRTKTRDSLGKRTASRSFFTVRAIAKPVIDLLEGLVAQASEEEGEEEDAETSEGEPVAAFANVLASTPGRHGTPFIAKKPAKRNEPSQEMRHFVRKEGTPTPTSIAGPEKEKR